MEESDRKKFAAEFARLGGPVWAKMTAGQRTERSKKMAKSRWDKRAEAFQVQEGQ